MTVLSEGYLNWAYVCESVCGWCGSKLKFYLDKGDRRVTFHPDSSHEHIKYICPICGERNQNTNINGKRKTTDVSVKYRKLTMQEYEDEVMPLEDEVVEMSDEDKAWLTLWDYVHKRN